MTGQSFTPIFDGALVEKYDTFGPRYTSYPTAVQFTDAFSEQDYRLGVIESNAIRKPLSLYFHIPFCESLCFYCACNKIITHTRKRALPYLERMHREIALQAALTDSERPVTQLHLGGGTPTFLSDEQLEALLNEAASHFTFAPEAQREFSIEIDPRAVRSNTIALLGDLGFNRISFGVQDFNPKVQEAVNRVQSIEQTRAVIDAARQANYRSVSVDLIYGLPFQNTENFARTLDTVIDLAPERLAIYNYAHLPKRVKAQKLIREETLPKPTEKLALLELIINRLQGAGYEYIGMDHFALPTEDLVMARNNGTLQRNFQGYSTHANADMIGMGLTSIGNIADSYSQNQRFEHPYFEAIDAGRLPIMKGYTLNDDDRLRREVIQQLMCQGIINLPQIEKRFDVAFSDYFAPELQALTEMADDGLVSVDRESITVQPLGRLLMRNIAMVFDAYMKQAARQQFSRAI